MKLKRLKIDQFRNVAPGTELHFRDSLNVLLGKNGTGKTTLLNLIVAVLSGRFTPFREESLKLEYELVTPQGSLTIHLQNQRVPSQLPLLDEQAQFVSEPPVFYAAEALASGGRVQHRALCDVLFQPKLSGKQYLLKVDGAAWELQEVGGAGIVSASLSRPLLEGSMMRELLPFILGFLMEKEEESNEQLLLARLLEVVMTSGLTMLRRFDESLGYLEELTREKALFEVRRLRDGYLISPKIGISRSIAQTLSEALKANSQADHLVMRDSDLRMGFLVRVLQLLGFTSAEARLQRTARKMQDVERLEFGDLQFYFARRDGSEIDSSRLSYGQKRLLSYYYYLECAQACVVADELVNGMHHEWIEACLEDLGERQSFLTSQNPLLLDYLSFGSADEVCSSFVLCHSELKDGRELLRWENMTPEDAQGFFGAYSVGIQHVSEILRTRGLW